MRLLVAAKVAPCSQSQADAVRNAREIADVDRSWLESFSPDAFLNAGRGARVELGGHDGVVVGTVFQVIAGRDGWFHGDLVLEVDEAQADLIRTGLPVSIDGRSIRRDDDHSVGTRRHRSVHLSALAIGTADTMRGVYPEAKIVTVREMKSSAPTKAKPKASGVDWRTVLPRDYAEFADLDIEVNAGDELLIGGAHRGARWDGERFHVAGAFARAA